MNQKLNYGYVVVGASLLIMVLIWGTNYCFGIFFKPLVADFGWTRAVTAGAFSLAILMEGVGSLFVGRLTDRFGARAVAGICGLFFGLGMFLMSRITAVGQLYLVYGGLLGLSLGGFYVPVMATIATWFKRRRGLMMAIVSAGISLGTLAMSPLANRLILDYGWRNSFVIFGLVSALGVFGAAQLMRSGKRGESGPDVPNPDPGLEPNPAPSQNLAPDLTLEPDYNPPFRRGKFLLLCGLMFSWAFCKYMVLVHLAPHVTDIGLSPTQAADILALLGGATFVMTLIMGLGTYRLGVWRTFVLGLGLMAGALVWLVFAKTVWGFYAFVVVFACGFAAGGVLMPALVAELFGLKSYGSLIGVGNFSACIGCATGPVLAGYLFDSTGSYSWAFMLIAAMAVVNVGLVLLLKAGRGRAAAPAGN